MHMCLFRATVYYLLSFGRRGQMRASYQCTVLCAVLINKEKRRGYDVYIVHSMDVYIHTAISLEKKIMLDFGSYMNV